MPKRTITTNPIIDQLKAAGGAGTIKLAGFIGRGSGDRLEIYTDLSLSGCIEVAEADIVHAVDGEDPTKPSMLFVRKGAKVVVRAEMTSNELIPSGSGGCPCGPGKTGSGEMARRRPADDEVDDTYCASRYLGCIARCHVNHSGDPMMLAGCLDNCDAAFRLCRSFGATGLVMY